MTEEKKHSSGSVFAAFDQYESGQSPHAAPYDRQSESYGRYLFGSGITRDGFGSDAEYPKWGDYTGSRMMIRLFSRGVLGATFYTLASRWAAREMPSYNVASELDWSKPLHVIARGFDYIYGKPIQALVKGYYRANGKTIEEAAKFAEEITTFRSLRNFAPELGPRMGRSLGAEVTAMTIDFAGGSVGDAWGRQIANVLDPNNHNSWEREDGSIDYAEFSRSVAKSAWHIFAKNQGEDWVAALPYVYQMRIQRQAIDKTFRGFRLSSDYSHNGGSWRVDEAGNVLSSYVKAGTLDLQLRFTGYNWYTLMYRDLYDYVGNAIGQYQATGELPSPAVGDHPIEGAFGAVAESMRYVAKSLIKATIYMTPAVPFFWAIRTPQTKYRGMAIQVDPYTNEVRPASRDMGSMAERFSKENTRGVLDLALNPFGKACFSATNWTEGIKQKMIGVTGNAHLYPSQEFIHEWINASLSYTPYMIAKAETAMRWDRPKSEADGMNNMDRGAYRLIDGVLSLNLGEIKGGLREIRDEILHPPSNRKLHAQDRERISKKMKEEIESKGTDELIDRLKSMPPSSRVTQVSAATRTAEASVGQEKEPSGWQQKEAHKQFMKELTPPTNTAIH